MWRFGPAYADTYAHPKSHANAYANPNTGT